MSLATLISNAKGGSQPTPSQSPSTASSKGVGRLLASAKPLSRAPSAPAPIPQSLGQKVGNGILKGATAVTDFLTPGVTDVLSSHIARATVPENQKQLITKPTVGQDIGAALQVASLVVPATGVERIAGSLAEGALARTALQGVSAGAQFGLLGGAGSELTNNPNATAKDVALESLKQGAIGAGLGSTLGLGGALVGKSLSKLLGKSKPLVEDVARETKIPVQSEAIENRIPISTPHTKQAEYAKSQGYEPYKSPEELPVIQAGGRVASELPTIQAEARPSKKLGDLTIEPIKTPALASQPAKIESTATQNVKVPESQPITTNIPKTSPGVVEPKIPTQGSGKVSKIASSINAKAIEEGLTTGFKDLAGYEPKVIKDQAQKIADFMGDIEKTRAVVRGEDPVPKGISGTYLLKATEDHAIRTGNGEILRELASSPLVSETSRFGQELRMAAERNPESPLKAISDINKAREGRIQRTGGNVKKSTTKDVADAQKEIKKNAPKKEDWASFIDSITC